MKTPQTFRTSKLEKFINQKETEIRIMKEYSLNGKHNERIVAFETLLADLRQEFNIPNDSELN